MATQNPISTISYNSEAFLREKLDTWIKAHIIQAYHYIKHKGEDGDKDHIHLRIEPNKKLDPMDLQEALLEYVQDNPKPLACRPFRKSKEEDWFLYVVHDPDYLKLKYHGGEKGEKLPYKWQDIVASENYDVEVAFVRAKASMQHTTVNMATRMQRGESPLSLVLEGENPYTVNALMRALATNDYQRLQREYDSVFSKLNALIQAVDDYGLSIEADDEGNIILKPFTGSPNHYPKFPDPVPEIPTDIDMEKAQMTLEDWDKCPEKESI